MITEFKNIHDFIVERFFCEKTGLIYDYLTDDENPAWSHIPLPGDIKKQYPNPCGWGTGMEDSVLNGGSALDAVVALYGVTENPVLTEIGEKLCDGLLLCARISSDFGFVPRSVSPVDGVSHYSNSSRDQYTHFVYSLVKYYFSPLSDEKRKSEIKKYVCAVADKCLREVTKENGYNLLREDGKQGIAGEMWGNIAPHEFLRLPMFYLAAYKVSLKQEYLEKYLEYRDEALKNTLPHRKNKCRGYVNLQLQYSLRFIYDYDDNNAVKQKVAELMCDLADFAEKKAKRISAHISKKRYSEKLTYKYKPWNKADRICNCGTFGGYEYLNPNQSEYKENKAFYPVREVGEYVSVAALYTCRATDKSCYEALLKTAAALNLKKHYTYAPLLLLSAYALYLENCGKSDKNI